MNEKNNIIRFVIVFVIGIILGIVITNRFYNSKIDDLSRTVASIEEINNRLQFSNTNLSSLNSRLTEEVGKLEKRIVDDYREYQERLGIVSSGLGEISEGLSGTGGDLQSIIDGMEEIKIGLRKIEISK